jgi:hypothetical protein
MRRTVNTRTTDKARQLQPSIKGQPGLPLPRLRWPRLVRPMRPLLSVRTLIKPDLAKGVTQPEFKDTIMRAGVGVRQRAITALHQQPITPPTPRANIRVVAPPSPTNRGGVRDPRTLRRVGRGVK